MKISDAAKRTPRQLGIWKGFEECNGAVKMVAGRCKGWWEIEEGGEGDM